MVRVPSITFRTLHLRGHVKTEASDAHEIPYPIKGKAVLDHAAGQLGGVHLQLHSFLTNALDEVVNSTLRPL